jgi:DNA polymerase III alpha subunit
LREEAGRAIVRARSQKPFSSLDDLHRRVPELRKDELRKLAAVGALNFIEEQKIGREVKGSGNELCVFAPLRETGPGSDAAALLNQTVSRKGAKTQRKPNSPQHPNPNTQPPRVNRRDALWQVERVSRDPGPLYEELEEVSSSPLAPMTLNERLNADLRGTGITIGRHPMAHQRAWLDTLKVARAGDLKSMRNGMRLKVAGWVIVRQRPGTAKGFLFLSLEDETGIANIIVTPKLFELNRLAFVNYPFLLIEGVLQHQDNVVSVKARRVEPLQMKIESPGSHDFH